MAAGIRTTPRFERRYRSLPDAIKARAKAKERIFRLNSFDARLKTHKLHGKERGLWAFWISYEYRIKFTFLPTGDVLFLDVGTHDIYS